MDFDYSPKTKALEIKLQKFMEDYIYPAEGAYIEWGKVAKGDPLDDWICFETTFTNGAQIPSTFREL